MHVHLLFVFLVVFSVGCVHSQAPCSDAEVEAFKSLVQICKTFPQNESSLNLGVLIIKSVPLGFAGNTTQFVQAFDAIAYMFASLFNVSLYVANVNDIQPAQLYPACTIYNELSATPLAAYLSLDGLGELLGFVRFGVLNALSPQPHASNFSANYYTRNGPGAVRLALVPEGMTVSWQTVRAYIHSPAVVYGTDPSDLNKVLKGTTHTYGTAYFHDVVLKPLKPSTVYYYSIVGDSTHSIYEFKSAPKCAVRKRKPFVSTIVGDMGYINADATHKALRESLSNTDVFIHIGDISYADNYFLRPEFAWTDTYEESWNVWQQWMMPITSRVPYMVLPGNHEAACQQFLNYMVCPPSQQNFTAYRHRFRMPSEESGAGNVENMWSSFTYGLVHYVMINTETDFTNSPEGPDKNTGAGPFGGGANPTQLAWLEADLRKANASRHVTPWIVVLGHRPIYTGIVAGNETNSIDGFNTAIPAAFEPILAKYNVDVYFAGHLHFYERLYPISNGVSQHYDGHVYLNPTAPTYIINGAAGNDEQHEDVVYNYTIGSYYNNKAYGYGKLAVYNYTHLHWQFIRSNTTAVDDELWIVKEGNAPTPRPHRPHDEEYEDDNESENDEE